LKAWYKRITGKELDLDNPITFNEKINWLKLNDRDPRKTILADKYLVRNYVKNTVGSEYLIPLLGVWDRFDDIDFEKLPDSFVLKCNHGCGWNYLVKNKSEVNMNEMKSAFDRWMCMNYSWKNGFELHYSGINPKIIAEEYLTEPNGYLLEIKAFAFNGQVKYLWTDIDKYGNHRRNIYTRDWNYVPCEIRYPTAPELIMEKPDWLEEVIDISDKLANDFVQVRLDYYIVKKRIYFGEMTFTQGSGSARMEPREFEIEFGNNIDISQLKG
jgi:hypothetical protein